MPCERRSRRSRAWRSFAVSREGPGDVSSVSAAETVVCTSSPSVLPHHLSANGTYFAAQNERATSRRKNKRK
eukprot:5658398-Lingulodinium_polyedra.AAC.1